MSKIQFFQEIFKIKFLKIQPWKKIQKFSLFEANYQRFNFQQNDQKSSYERYLKKLTQENGLKNLF